MVSKRVHFRNRKQDFSFLIKFATSRVQDMQFEFIPWVLVREKMHFSVLPSSVYYIL